MQTTEKSQHPPSYRKWYVDRAAELLGDPEFLQVIELARDSWNQGHQTLTIIPKLGLALPRPEPVDMPIPPGMFMIQEEAKRLADSMAHSPLSPSALDRLTYYHGEQTALTEWYSLVYIVCRNWFPADSFPNWLGNTGHPADLFVAGYLCFGPLRINPDWIRVCPIVAYQLPYDPMFPLAHPAVAAITAKYAAVITEIRNRLTKGEAITSAVLDQVEENGAKSASDAFVQSSLKMLSENHLVVSVAGCNTTDLQLRIARNPQIVKAARSLLVSKTGNVQRRRVRHLHASGLSNKEIAKRVGIAASIVAKWLSEPLV